jgi:hypothetical protein
MGSLPAGNTYLWVDSVNGGTGNPGTFDQPYATLQAAITASVANSGTVTYKFPAFKLR